MSEDLTHIAHSQDTSWAGLYGPTAVASHQQQHAKATDQAPAGLPRAIMLSLYGNIGVAQALATDSSTTIE